MIKSSKWILLLLTIVLFSTNSCTVSLNGASIPPEAKTISIDFFPNNAPMVNPTLSQVFTDRLKDKFTSETSLNLVEMNGDLNISGEIVGYRTQPVAIQGDETAAKNRLTITVKVSFTNLYDDKMDFENTFSRYEEYESTQSLASVEDALIETISEYLIEDIFNKAVVNW